MPEFEYNIEIEVICNDCGNGLCMDSDVRTSRNRSMPQVMVSACPKCMEKKDDEINELKEEIESLKNI